MTDTTTIADLVNGDRVSLSPTIAGTVNHRTDAHAAVVHSGGETFVATSREVVYDPNMERWEICKMTRATDHRLTRRD